MIEFQGVSKFFHGKPAVEEVSFTLPAGELARPGEPLPGPPISAAMSRRAALYEFIARATDRLPVVDEQGGALGVLHFADLLRPLKETE